MSERGKRTGDARRSDAAGPRGAGPLTAQAIVRAASGKRLKGSEPITTRTLAEHQPLPADVETAQAAFEGAGFEVGQLGGISFAITAPKERFEQLFGVELDVDERGAVSLAGKKAPSGGLELPLGRLPAAVRDRLEAVVFTPPADLHAGGDEGSALF